MKCIDLFAGCGGLSLGFELANYEIIAAYDNWQPALDVYQNNFNHAVFNLDLSDEKKAIAQILPMNPDLIIGGPPCQDFSSAGKRDVSQGRADLTRHFANIICSIKPNWFVMENVERIKKTDLLRQVINQFIEKGYGLSSVILNAAYCDVPQARTRFFLIGHLGDYHNQLNKLFQARLSDSPMTVQDYLGDSLGLEFYYRHPRNYNRRGIFSIYEPSPTVRGVNRPIPKGYKLNSCDPSHVNLADLRPLTTLERSYIQTFPKTFKFFGTKTNLEQMIGNAVPVNLAKFVAETIQIYCQTGSEKDLPLLEMLNFTHYDFQLSQKALKKREKSYF
ncbi:DNA cytosine methyltransferase [Spirulina major CS-329]|uniref:DNA cytosine methyltransferase n=1 Tax=Spirulina TaxID=1154 RepID=UPI00232CC49F|nr:MULTISPECIES: DNA cytosine methyltransferase [Spirulina]MDB9496506.1 DNA cytosine methyltransferase [Spirulina subsalsa CS-330]MDB9502023.1 DNA cytosine methyltransferase [Spirulina major CS-329]